MDTDLIFKRGVAYTLATGLLLGVYFGIIALISVVVHNAMPEAVREWGLVIAILVTAAIFDPLKRRIQGWVDRAFDRHRYDYRKALVEFGRGLSSETDLERCSSPSSSACRARCWWRALRSFWCRNRAACAWPPPMACLPK
jgi:two-component system NtrC family sensor kinase